MTHQLPALCFEPLLRFPILAVARALDEQTPRPDTDHVRNVLELNENALERRHEPVNDVERVGSERECRPELPNLLCCDHDWVLKLGDCEGIDDTFSRHTSRIAVTCTRTS